MALISPDVFRCVVEILDSSFDAESANDKTPIIGTGFLYGLKADEEGAYTFMVTAKHVIKDEKNIWIRFNKNDGSTGFYEEVYLENAGHRFVINHPKPSVDVSVYPISMDYMRSLKLEDSFIHSHINALTRKEAATTGLQEGDRIIVLGFPLGLSGYSRKSVIARGGIIAKFQDFLRGDDDYFLIDSHAFPGNSGGPVFNVPELGAIEGTKSTASSNLIGLAAEYLVFKDKEDNRAEFHGENSGLVVVEPVDHINEAIEHAVAELERMGFPAK